MGLQIPLTGIFCAFQHFRTGTLAQLHYPLKRQDPHSLHFPTGYATLGLWVPECVPVAGFGEEGRRCKSVAGPPL